MADPMTHEILTSQEFDLSEIPDLSTAFPDFRLVEQQLPGECGTACIVDAARYILGSDVSQAEIKKMLNIDPLKGTSHLKIREGGESLGLDVEVSHDPLIELHKLIHNSEESIRVVLDIMNNRPVSEGGVWDGLDGEFEGGHYVIFEGLCRMGREVFAAFNNPEYPAKLELIPLKHAQQIHYDYNSDTKERLDRVSFIFRAKQS